jgi:hypothetical protein
MVKTNLNPSKYDVQMAWFGQTYIVTFTTKLKEVKIENLFVQIYGEDKDEMVNICASYLVEVEF